MDYSLFIYLCINFYYFLLLPSYHLKVLQLETIFIVSQFLWVRDLGVA